LHQEALGSTVSHDGNGVICKCFRFRMSPLEKLQARLQITDLGFDQEVRIAYMRVPIYLCLSERPLRAREISGEATCVADPSPGLCPQCIASGARAWTAARQSLKGKFRKFDASLSILTTLFLRFLPQ
jgi:hypothetical protein